jgi:hypothetical protein
MASSKGPSAKLGCCPARAIFAEVAQLHGGADCGFACASRSRSPQRFLWVCGSASKLLGLGLAPNFSILNAHKGPFLLFLLTLVANGYIHTYGWPLVFCAIALGFGIAIWFERKTHKLLNRVIE